MTWQVKHFQNKISLVLLMTISGNIEHLDSLYVHDFLEKSVIVNFIWTENMLILLNTSILWRNAHFVNKRVIVAKQ